MLRSFRLVCPAAHIPLVEALLRAEGYAFENEAFSSWCRILTEEPRPLGSSLAAFFGLIYIQDRSSMLPPLALFPQDASWQTMPAQERHGNGPAVLDMCASPGSKTGFLGQLVGNHGFVLGNEPSKARLATLRANMQSLSSLHIGTCSYTGESLPLLAESWDFIQLDPPCSGWGTVEKNPQVLDLWQGDKVKPLIGIQRLLLQKAWELLRPGGVVVYSTCTTNVQENEEQVRFAVEELGFEVLPLPPFEGFVWEEPLACDGNDKQLAAHTLRVDGQRSHAQGFYIAKFRKPLSSSSGTTPSCGTGSMKYEGAQHDVSAKIMANEDAHTAPLFTVEHALSPSLLEGPCTDMSLLPAGQLALFGDTVRFVPKAVMQCLPQHMQWQAAPVGKLVGDSIRQHPRCRWLMPYVAPEEALVLENSAHIRALLQGQSLQSTLSGRETGLYFGHNGQTLALGRIGLKKGRAIWTEKKSGR